jgi:transposase InsO family protein
VLTEGGQRYFMTITDDASRYCYVYLLKTKDEALNCFKTYKAEVENQLEKKIKRFRSDRGGEYFSNEFDLFCAEHGIIHERTMPYSPQSNGVAKRKNRTSTDLVNSMLDTVLAVLKLNRIIRKCTNTNCSSFHLRVFLGLSNPQGQRQTSTISILRDNFGERKAKFNLEMSRTTQMQLYKCIHVP